MIQSVGVGKTSVKTRSAAPGAFLGVFLFQPTFLGTQVAVKKSDFCQLCTTEESITVKYGTKLLLLIMNQFFSSKKIIFTEVVCMDTFLPTSLLSLIS